MHTLYNVKYNWNIVCMLTKYIPKYDFVIMSIYIFCILDVMSSSSGIKHFLYRITGVGES